MAKFDNLTEVVSDLMENDFEDAARAIVDLTALVVSEEADGVEEVETILNLQLPTLKSMVGDDEDSEDGDDLLGAI